MRLPSHHSHKDTDAPGLVFFQSSALLVPWPMGELGQLISLSLLPKVVIPWESCGLCE